MRLRNKVKENANSVKIRSRNIAKKKKKRKSKHEMDTNFSSQREDNSKSLRNGEHIRPNQIRSKTHISNSPEKPPIQSQRRRQTLN